MSEHPAHMVPYFAQSPAELPYPLNSVESLTRQVESGNGCSFSLHDELSKMPFDYSLNLMRRMVTVPRSAPCKRARQNAICT